MATNDDIEVTPAVAVSDFGSDSGATTLRAAGGAYVARLRSGDTGVVPAMGGLVVLFLIFTFTKESFLTDLNFANLLQQATWLTVLAMAVTFVLLLGEIDLAAGATMGVTSAIVYLRVKNGVPIGAELLVAIILGAALLVGIGSQLRKAGRPSNIALAIGAVVGIVVGVLLVAFAPTVMIAILLGMIVGVAMGAFTGFLVAKVGIPSFVVTLALFLAWQGLLLKIAKEGGSIRIDDKFLRSLSNSPMRPALGWVLFVVVVGGFVLMSLVTRGSRVRKGVSAQALSVIAAKTVALAAVWAFVTFRLNHNRALPNAVRPLRGVPYVVPLVLVLAVLLTFLLNRTAWGRHLYAVGGNAEAARRAGINVARLRLSAFAIVGFLASIAGLVYGSRVGSVTPQTGAGDELLRAVGAAVVGGVSLFGGRGKVVYAIIGGLVMATIENGLGLYKTILGADVDAGFKLMVAGAVLLLAGGVDALTRRGAAASR